MDCTIRVAKAKALLSFASLFSHMQNVGFLMTRLIYVFKSILLKVYITYIYSKLVFLKEHTHRQNANITGIVYLYFWEFDHEIRAFGQKKFIIEV